MNLLTEPILASTFPFRNNNIIGLQLVWSNLIRNSRHQLKPFLQNLRNKHKQ